MSLYIPNGIYCLCGAEHREGAGDGVKRSPIAGGEAHDRPSITILTGECIVNRLTPQGLLSFALLLSIAQNAMVWAQSSAGDWGSTITELLARDHADEVVGIHLTDVPFIHSYQKPKSPSHAEKKYLDAIGKFPQTQGAYALVQASQPHPT
jgi:hypothetical protein